MSSNLYRTALLRTTPCSTMIPMKILTAAEMQACDRLTSEKFGISPTQLMQSAAQAVVSFAAVRFPAANRVTILCGRGNNGADGIHAALLLAKSGIEVAVLLFGDPEGLRGDTAAAWTAFTSGHDVARHGGAARAWHVIRTPEDLHQHSSLLDTDLIIDAIVGTGFKPPLRDLPLAALQWMQSTKSRTPILAIDLPSGWDADTTRSAPAGPVFAADAVVTFTAPKPAHLFGQLTRRITSPIVVAQIGSPDEAIRSSLNLHWTGSAKAITDPDRPFDSNKGMYGHVLVVGGSVGKSGAPGMTSLAALRAGAGLVTAAVAPPVLPLVASLAPELMTHALAIDADGEISAENIAPKRLEKLLQKISVLAIGPGLGTSPQTTQFALGLLNTCRLPAVVDADALNILSKHPESLAAIAEDRTLVFTPHPGEMARLTGLTIQDIEANRIPIAREFATKHRVTLVLKGWRTLVAHADGSIAVNTTGNPAMAKGGSGDLLTGFVASMLAQHPGQPQLAVEAAVYLHGLAADIAVRSPGIGGDQHTLLATDSLLWLHKAFHFHPDGDSGYCWLQGLPEETVSSPSL